MPQRLEDLLGTLNLPDEDRRALREALAARDELGERSVLANDDATINPGASEVSGDGVDNDCDGIVDPPDPDLDGDGYTVAGGDCDDDDAGIHPGAVEICDGIDQDCDGVVDEETECFDDDGDGYSEDQGDCNDNDSEVNPEGYESLNGVDDDCDGSKDEDYPFVGGTCLVGQGVCRELGQGYCNQNGPECNATSAFPPTPEETCGNREDDNCNGVEEEGCICPPGSYVPCGPTVGACQSGFMECQEDGTFSGKCTGVVLPEVEIFVLIREFRRVDSITAYEL